MLRRELVFVFLLTAMSTCSVASAQISIDELIRVANLREGDVATKDLERWQSPSKIVVRASRPLTATLQAAFPEVSFVSVTSVAEAVEEVADADAVIGFCSPQVINAGTRLVWAQVGSAGVERCMRTASIADGTVLLTNMQKMSSPVIGEHAIALMLSLARAVPQQAKAMSDGNWNRGAGRDYGMVSLYGKTVLITGLGGIGNAAAWRADALGMRVIATRNSSREGPEFVDYVGLSHELLDLAAQADVVINALPLTPKTTGIFNAEFFDAAKPGLIFINVARGGSVVTDDLLAALRDGRVAGAGLDVTDPEPLPPDHPLWQQDNVIITPHIAWFGSTGEREAALAKENVRRFIAGEALLNVVDPARGY